MVTALWKPRLPVPLPAASCEEMDRKKHPGYVLFSFCKIMNLFVIAAFFGDNFKHIHMQTGYFKM